MKQMKKLTRNQKIIMSSCGYDPKLYALITDNTEVGVFVVGLKDYPETRMYFEYTSSTTGKRISEEDYVIDVY